jgi:hypothetical protein
VQPLNFPTYSFQLREGGGSRQIYDVFRRKWLVLTPEEWVRQHAAMYLIDSGYPRGLMALEKSLVLNGMQRRADIIVYDRAGAPFLLVECKSTDVKISQKTIDQAARYNLTLKVPYLFITNGLNHYCLQQNNGENHGYMQGLPEFPKES